MGVDKSSSSPFPLDSSKSLHNNPFCDLARGVIQGEYWDLHTRGASIMTAGESNPFCTKLSGSNKLIF